MPCLIGGIAGKLRAQRRLRGLLKQLKSAAGMLRLHGRMASSAEAAVPAITSFAYIFKDIARACFRLNPPGITKDLRLHGNCM
jgi:hypothetical protein